MKTVILSSVLAIASVLASPEQSQAFGFRGCRRTYCPPAPVCCNPTVGAPCCMIACSGGTVSEGVITNPPEFPPSVDSLIPLIFEVERLRDELKKKANQSVDENAGKGDGVQRLTDAVREMKDAVKALPGRKNEDKPK